MGIQDIEQKQSNEYGSDIRYLNIPSYLIAVVVVLIFFLPHICLRFSSIAVISVLNAIFLLSIVFVPFLLALNRLSIPKYVVLVQLLFLFTLLYGVVKGGVSGLDLGAVMKSGFESLGPVAFFLLLLISNALVLSIYRGLLHPFLFVAFINAIYSIYQRFFIDHYQEIWFYRPLLVSQGYDTPEWDIVRDGVVRASGLFISSLENGYVITLVCFYFGIMAIKRKSYLHLIALVFYLWVGYLTGARTYIIGLIVGVISWMLIKKGWAKHPFLPGLIVPFVAIALTLASISLWEDKVDLSSAGRLVQSTNLLLLMQENLFGLGFGSVGFGADYIFDSTYATWLISCGLFGGLAIIYIYYWSSKQLFFTIMKDVNRKDVTFNLALFLSSVVLVYSAAFQYTTHTSIRWFYALAAALMINKTRMERRMNCGR